MIIDNTKNSALYLGANKRFEKAFAFIEKAVKENLPAGKYEIDGKEVYASVLEYNSKAKADAKFEGHKNYIDIQYIVSGIEEIAVADIGKVTKKTEYNAEKDVEFYELCGKETVCVLESGEYAILFPQDIHQPSVGFQGVSAPVKKIVVKVKA